MINDLNVRKLNKLNWCKFLSLNIILTFCYKCLYVSLLVLKIKSILGHIGHIEMAQLKQFILKP